MRLAILCSLALVLLAGCPREKRALNAARKAVEVAAQTVALVDAEHAAMYLEASSAALELCPDRACYDAHMKRWNKTVLAVSSMKQSLLTVEVALDAWEAGSVNGALNLRGAAACFLETLVRLQDLLTDLGADAPSLNHGISYGSDLFGLGGTACPAGATS
jgi:hypothetical protein